MVLKSENFLTRYYEHCHVVKLMSQFSQVDYHQL